MLRKVFVASLSAALVFATSPGFACTGISLKAEDGAAIRARTLEFGFPMQSNVLIVPAGQEVAKLDSSDVARFHSNSDGSINLHYYSQVIANAGQFAIPLLSSIIDQLAANCSEAEAQRLSVLKDSLTWQGTFGGMKL